MRDVKYYRHAEFTHDRKRAHIDHQIVVAKADSALSDHQPLAAGSLRFLDNIPRVLRRQELALS